MELPARLMGHNCEEEIERIQGYLDLIEQEINSIKTKNPDAKLVMDSVPESKDEGEGIFLVLGARYIWKDHSNGGDYWCHCCYEDVIHRFNNCGIIATTMEQYSYYHED